MKGEFPHRVLYADFVVRDRRLGDSPDVKIELTPVPRSDDVRDNLRNLWRTWKTLPKYSFPAITQEGLVWLNPLRRWSAAELNYLLFLLGLTEFLCVSDPKEEMAPKGRKEFWSSEGCGEILKGLREECLEKSPPELAEEIGVAHSTLSRWEGGHQAPNPTSLYEWCRALGLFCPRKTALVSVIDISPQLLRSLAHNPEELRRLEPDQFERFVANRLDRMGYNVSLSSQTFVKDGGIDIIGVPKTASVGTVVLAVQVKHHRGPQKTGREAVDRLVAWKGTPFGAGLLVTNTGFTRDAVWAAAQEHNRYFIRLRDFNDLKRWLQNRYGEEQDWRELPDHVDLVPGLTIQIPKPSEYPRFLSSPSLSARTEQRRPMFSQVFPKYFTD